MNQEELLSQELAKYSTDKATQLLAFLDKSSEFLSNETLKEYRSKLNFFIQNADNISCSSPEILECRKGRIDIAAQQIQTSIEMLKKVELSKSKVA